MLGQDTLSLCAAPILVRPAEIAIYVLGVRPFLGRHAFEYEACSPRRWLAAWPAITNGVYRRWSRLATGSSCETFRAVGLAW